MSLAVVAYIYNTASAAYIYPVKFLFDGVEYNSINPSDIFVKIMTNPGSHQIKMILPGYVVLEWGTWPERNIGAITFTDKGANPTTIDVSGDLCYIYCTILVTYGKVTVTGKAKGGYPTPSMRLEIYEKEVLILSGEIPSGQLQINQPYTLSYEVTSPNNTSFQGRMVLTNPVKQAVFKTTVTEFGLSFAITVMTQDASALIPGASIKLYCSDGAWAGKTLTGTSGANGRLDFYPFKTGTYQLTVTKAGFVDWYHPAIYAYPGRSTWVLLTPS